MHFLSTMTPLTLSALRLSTLQVKSIKSETNLKELTDNWLQMVLKL